MGDIGIIGAAKVAAVYGIRGKYFTCIDFKRGDKNIRASYFPGEFKKVRD